MQQNDSLVNGQALPATPGRAARRERWAAAWVELTNATNAYAENMLNAKIESPVRGPGICAVIILLFHLQNAVRPPHPTHPTPPTHTTAH